jgi:hypothetical protein
MIDISITATCEVCKKNILIDEGAAIYCSSCHDGVMSNKDLDEYLKGILTNLSETNFIWEGQENIEELNNEDQKFIYIKGMKYGYFSALFHFAYLVGLIKFYEENIDYKFTKKKE